MTAHLDCAQNIARIADNRCGSRQTDLNILAVLFNEQTGQGFAPQASGKQSIFLAAIRVNFGIHQSLPITIDNRDVIQTKRTIGGVDKGIGFCRAAPSHRLKKTHPAHNKIRIDTHFAFDFGKSALDNIGFFGDTFPADFFGEILRILH